MKNRFAFLPVVLSLAVPATANDLPRGAPEAQGIPSAAVLSFLAAADEQVDSLHSFMLLRHGTVVAEGWWTPYTSEDPHVLYSLSKSFTSTGIGLAIAEGRVRLDDRVLDAFPEDAPAEPSENLKAMRVRDLLSMSTGHHADTIEKFPYDSEERLSRLFLALPVAHRPGTHFVYNTPASYMLSAIVQKAAGSTLLDYLRPRLLDPLGIDKATWDADRHGVSLGGFGLSLTTEAVARFGQLYLQKGTWRGRTLLPAPWVEAATARQTSNGSNPDSDWEQGYGYQFWRSRHRTYRGDGAFGQFCMVLPEQDAVVAITSGTREMGKVMSLVWEHLLPAMGGEALSGDAAGAATLARNLASLSLPPQGGDRSSNLAASVSGRRYRFPDNDERMESLTLETAGGKAVLALSVAGRESRVPVGSGGWGPRAVLATDRGDQKVAASGAWTAPDTYTVKLCLYETPFVVTSSLRFAGEEVTFEREFNVAFGERKRPTLVGRR